MSYTIVTDHRKYNRDYVKIQEQVMYYKSGELVELYLQTPAFTVISITPTSSGYSILGRIQDVRFAHVINSIDAVLLSTVELDIVNAFIPSLKLNPATGMQELFRFDVPVIHRKPCISVYDEDSEQIPFSMIDVGFTGYAIIKPVALVKNEVRWETPQVKVIIPEHHFDNCILSDDHEVYLSSDEEYQDYFIPIQKQ